MSETFWSDREWKSTYTCHYFAVDFIKIAEPRAHYVFTYYVLEGEGLEKLTKAIESIAVIKSASIWRYTIPTNPIQDMPSLKRVSPYRTIVVERNHTVYTALGRTSKKWDTVFSETP